MEGKEKPKRIVIVEDSQEIREIYEMKLQSGGYEVLTAKDGELGESLIKKERPDLVLLDIMLPKKDGYDIMKDMKTGGAGEIPVIVISNLSSKEDALEAKKLGAVDYFIKADLTPADVLWKVDMFFKNNKPNSLIKFPNPPAL